jgi:thiamine-phosphate pyrophosphorylase
MDLLTSPLYPITSPTDRNTHLDWVQIFLSQGIRLFQVRDKQASDRDLFLQLLEIQKLCDQFGATVIINDRVDLALAVGAKGIHLGQSDLPAPEARRLLGPKALIGVSTHNRDQFLAATREPVDYIAVGPIYPTQTKLGCSAPVGTEFVSWATRHSDCPIVAIGGITLANVRDIWRAGARSVAVVSDITKHPDPALRIRKYMERARG